MGTKKEAERILAARQEQIRVGTFRELRKSTFDEFMDSWLQDHKSEYKPSTFRAYASMDKQHLRPAFGPMQLRSIDPERIQRLVSGLGASHSVKTARNVHGLLARALDDAVRLSYLGVNPAKSVKRPRILLASRAVDEESIYSAAQVQKLLETVGEHDPVYLKALIAVLALSGLRLGETLGLLNRNLLLDRGIIRVRHSLDKGELLAPKSKRSIRDVAVPQRLVHYLKQYRLRFDGPKKAESFVFANSKGEPLDPDNLRKRVWYPLLVRAELPRIRLHDLRHTFASLLISGGANVLVVRDQMGHASAAFTLDRYGHLFPNSRKEAADSLESLVFGGQSK